MQYVYLFTAIFVVGVLVMNVFSIQCLTENEELALRYFD